MGRVRPNFFLGGVEVVVAVLQSVLRVHAHVIVAKLCLLLGQILDFLGDMATTELGDTREQVEAPWDGVSSFVGCFGKHRRGEMAEPTP